MRSLLSLSLFFMFILYSGAQEIVLDKVLPFNNSRLEIIKEGESVKGYYFFYQLDKKDNKDNFYLLNTYDDKLNEVHSRGFKFPLKQRLLRVEYNGSGFCMQLFNPTGCQYDYIFLDQDLKESGKLSQKVPKDIAYNITLQQRYHTMIPVQGKGFAIYGVYPQSKKWEMHAFNLQGEEMWKQARDNSDKWNTESVSIPGGTSQNLALYETGSRYEKKRLVKRHFLRMLDAGSGQEIFKTEIKPLHATNFIDLMPVDEGYFLIGKYTDNKTGLVHGDVLISLDNNGNIQAEKYIVFPEAALLLREGQENRATFQNRSVRIREVQMMSNSYFLIAELFDKKENALTGTDPLNLTVFEMNKDLVFRDFYLLESTGSPATKNRFLYTEKEERGSSLKLVFDRELEPNSDNIIIGYATFHRNKIKPGDVKMFTRAPKYKILQAIPGKIVFFEYYEKEKRVNLRLEKF